MSLRPKVLGIIPARGGSKRVKRKNLRVLLGKPLIQYAIDAANMAQQLATAFVVSTDDYEIGRVAADCGAYVVRRPEDLATDWTSSDAVVLHALNWMGAENYDIALCLHPTSPIRDPKHIDQAIDLLWASGAPALASVEYRKRTYTHNASIYAVKVPWFLESQKLFCDESIPFLMDRRHSVDIDTEDDFRIAELFLQ